MAASTGPVPTPASTTLFPFTFNLIEAVGITVFPATTVSSSSLIFASWYMQDSFSDRLEICISDPFSFITQFLHAYDNIIDLLIVSQKAQVLLMQGLQNSCRHAYQGRSYARGLQVQSYGFIGSRISEEPMDMYPCFMCKCISAYYRLIGATGIPLSLLTSREVV